MPGLDDLVRRWRFRQNAATTVVLCDALVEAAALPGAETDPTLIDEVGSFALELAPEEARVLVAAGRMYLAGGHALDAVRLLVHAEELEPSPDLTRLVAEALLRRGDAEGAVLAFERCIRGGVDDADTVTLHACAQTFARIQEAAGLDATAREVERELGLPGTRYWLPCPRIAATIPRPPPATDHAATVEGAPDYALLRAAGAQQRTMRQPLEEVMAMAVDSRPSALPPAAPKSPGADAAARKRSPSAQRSVALTSRLEDDGSLTLPIAIRGDPADAGPWSRLKQPHDPTGSERARSQTRSPYGRLRIAAVFAVGIVLGATILYLIGMTWGVPDPAEPTSPPGSARPSAPAGSRRAPPKPRAVDRKGRLEAPDAGEPPNPSRNPH